jgi:hypothetical protein
MLTKKEEVLAEDCSRVSLSTINPTQAEVRGEKGVNAWDGGGNSSTSKKFQVLPRREQYTSAVQNPIC